MRTLIITEKPKVSRRIASVLSQKYTKKSEKGVPYYLIKQNGHEIYVASAAGHLYALEQKGKKGWVYPVFDIQWTPSYKMDKSKRYVAKYIKVLSTLSKKVDEFCIATDWDIEGELLGFNALRFSCNVEKAKRMRFSTLTHRDLIKAYEGPGEIDMALVDAGETRHIMDWYWGINTTRALTLALKDASGRFSTISAGRVQTPALAILVRRDREIKAFKPEKYWEVFADLDAKGVKLKARHEEGRIFEEGRVKEIIENSAGESAIVKDINKEESRNIAPFPFDLGTLQSEAYRVFNFNPKKTQTIAQTLYEAGYISYPRTSSQKLPPGIGYKAIVERLGASSKFKKYSEMLLKKSALKPRQGRKVDPAHPAIYPTGILPKKLGLEEEKLYRLVVHRFFAAFGDPMVRETTSVRVMIGREYFGFGGVRTVEKGWSNLYPFIKFEEVTLPELRAGDSIKVLKIYFEEKETEPPKKYNPASLIKELERRGLGTKATRAEIIDTLYQRGYVRGMAITVTDIGFSVIDALERHVPEIISEKLTRRFEKMIEDIQNGKGDKEKVLEEARVELTKILKSFKEKEKEIGLTIERAIEKTNRERYVVGKCPRCNGELKIIKSGKTGKQFIGCSNFPKCSTSYPLPQSRSVKVTDKLCNACGLPMVSIRFGRRRALSCIDMNCKSKKYKKSGDK